MMNGRNRLGVAVVVWLLSAGASGREGFISKKKDSRG